MNAKKYIASIEVNNNLEVVTFETDGNPIEYIWGRYGLSSYIARLEKVTPGEDSLLDKEE